MCAHQERYKVKEQQGMLSAGKVHLVVCCLAWTHKHSVKAAYDCAWLAVLPSE